MEFVVSLEWRQEAVRNSDGVGQPSYTVTVYRPGAVVRQADSGVTTILLHTTDLANSFSVGDKILINPGAAQVYSGINTVLTVNSNGIVMDGGSFTVALGDVIFSLGPDGGSAAPDFDGSDINLYQRPNSVLPTITEARVTADSLGNYEYWTDSTRVWELIRDTDGTVSGVVREVPTVTVPDS